MSNLNEDVLPREKASKLFEMDREELIDYVSRVERMLDKRDKELSDTMAETRNKQITLERVINDKDLALAEIEEEKFKLERALASHGISLSYNASQTKLKSSSKQVASAKEKQAEKDDEGGFALEDIRFSKIGFDLSYNEVNKAKETPLVKKPFQEDLSKRFEVIPEEEHSEIQDLKVTFDQNPRDMARTSLNFKPVGLDDRISLNTKVSIRRGDSNIFAEKDYEDEVFESKPDDSDPLDGMSPDYKENPLSNTQSSLYMTNNNLDMNLDPRRPNLNSLTTNAFSRTIAGKAAKPSKKDSNERVKAEAKQYKSSNTVTTVEKIDQPMVSRILSEKADISLEARGVFKSTHLISQPVSGKQQSKPKPKANAEENLRTLYTPSKDFICYDFLDLHNRVGIVNMLEKYNEDVSSYEIFSDFVFEIKEHKKSKKLLFITSNSISLIRVYDYSVKLRKDFSNLERITISEKNTNLIALHFEGEDDILMEILRRMELVYYFADLYKIKNIRNIKFRCTDQFKVRRNGHLVNIVINQSNQYHIAPNFDNSRKLGYLMKASGGFFGGWKEKLVVLSDIGLLYFDDPNKKPGPLIPITGSEIYKVEEKKFKRKFCFEILTINGQVFNFAARNEEEMESWLDEFKAVRKEYEQRIKSKS